MCTERNKIFNYRKSISPFNLKKHSCCKRYSNTSYSKSDDNGAQIRKKYKPINEEIRKDMPEKWVQYVAYDFRPFNTVIGEGFKLLTRGLVEAGVKIRE